MTQFQPLVVESFESGPELYLAVLRRTPHRASEIVRYLRGTVSPPPPRHPLTVRTYVEPSACIYAGNAVFSFLFLLLERCC